MKKIHFLLLAAAALFTATAIQAQTSVPSARPAAPSARSAAQQHKTPEQLAVMQARHIATELAFDEETSRQFTEAYCRYQKELRELKASRPLVKNDKEQTEEAIRESILAQFDQSRKIVDLREKFYKEYSRLLTQRQIRRVYDIERKMGQHLRKNGSRRTGIPNSNGDNRTGKPAGNRAGQR